jgi:hypothetical protein
MASLVERAAAGPSGCAASETRREREGGALFRRDDEDPETYAAMVRMARRENDALLLADKLRGALKLIADGYGVNHTSRWARDHAFAALRAACEEQL